MARRAASDRTIRLRAREILGYEILDEDTLAERMTAAGVDVGADGASRVSRVLDGSSEFVELDDGWLSVPDHLDATTWCTRVAADDVADGILPAKPDLDLLGWWCLDVGPQVAGADGAAGRITLADGEEDLLGPAGWLAGIADGGAVAVSITGTEVEIRPVEVMPVPTPELVVALQRAFEDSADATVLEVTMPSPVEYDLEHAEIHSLLWQALATHRAAFLAGPIPPIDDVLAAAGLERRDFTVARQGFSWDGLFRWQLRNRLRGIRDVPEELLEPAEVVIGLGRLVISEQLADLGLGDAEQHIGQAAAMALSVPAVAEAVRDELVSNGAEADDLLRFARWVVDLADGPAGGARWLAGWSLERLGDLDAAEAELTMAAEEGHALALRALAAFHADRGDAAGALTLLRQAEVDDEDDELVEEVIGYAAARPRRTVGRNDPCPCGSGRKYKVCHLGREPLPLIDRGPWLYAKARRYLADHGGELVAALNATVGRVSGRGYRALSELDAGQLVDDVALAEGGVLAEFSAERGALLPDDEALLVASWQLVERSLFEIEDVGRDWVRLRDVRTGDRIEVTNTNADPRSGPGLYLLGRPLPIEGTWRAYSGFVLVGGPLVDEALDVLDAPDAFDVAELIGATLRLPEMRNSDGQRLAFHELTWRLPDAAAAAERLAASDLHADGDGRFTLVRDSANQPATLIITFEVDGDELRATANSAERAEEARELIAGLLPDAELIDDDVRELDEVMAESDDDGEDEDGDGAETIDPDDPAVREALEEFMLDYERRWLDESIPALDGLTPRQAAVDPIGRHELERLLATFPPADNPMSMDPERIRRTLDLTP